jgi:hypothetical protein
LIVGSLLRSTFWVVFAMAIFCTAAFAAIAVLFISFGIEFAKDPRRRFAELTTEDSFVRYLKRLMLVTISIFIDIEGLADELFATAGRNTFCNASLMVFRTPFSLGRIVTVPIQSVKSRIPFTIVSPMLLMRIVSDGMANNDQKTKNGFPALETGNISP